MKEIAGGGNQKTSGVGARQIEFLENLFKILDTKSNIVKAARIK